MASWGVSPDICEIQVQSDQHSILSIACREDLGVKGSSQSLGHSRLEIVSHVRTLPTGHSPFFAAPGQLAAQLDSLQ